MKRIIIFLFALLFVGIAQAQAQSISFTLNQQPCNNNGIVTATVTGLSNPFTITYSFGSSQIQHVVNSGNTDVLNNYDGTAMYVWAIDNSQTTAYGNFSALPFNVSLNQFVTVQCPNLANIPVTVTGGASPYTYDWIDKSTSATVSTSNPANLPGGFYDLIVTDNNGCTVQVDSGVTVYSMAQFQVSTSTTPANCTNGTASLSITGSGTPPYSYLWDNNATTTTISNLTQGGHSVTVTDAIGCSAMGYAYVSQGVTINPNIVATPATCVQNNGVVQSFPTGGMPPYTYLWSNLATTQTQTGLSSGAYTVTVTDANGCTGTSNTYVSATTPINATYTVTPSSCTAATGSATLSISGGATPYTISWGTFPAQTGVTASNLPAGTYSFNITDANGCVRNGTVAIPPVNIISTTFTSTSPMCTQANGSLSVSASGGTTPYTYSWSNSANTSSITGLTAGSYSVTITDNAGCSVTKSKYLAPYSPVSLGFNTTPASCIYNSDGVVVATVYNGTPPYTWNTPSGTGTVSNLAPGIYSLSVTDANGCSVNQNAHVSYNSSNNSCYCTIAGTVYDDANGNCTQDAGENGIPNIQMHLSGFGYAYTNSAGVYSFKAPSGSYTLSESVQAIYPLASCQNNSIPVSVVAASNCSQTFDFANGINPLHDVKVTTWNYNYPVPGFNYYAAAIVSNDGTVSESNIVAGYNNDNQLSAPVMTPSAVWAGSGSQYNVNTSANFSLAPGASQAFYINNSIPTNMPLGTQLTLKDTVAYTSPMSNWMNDYTPANNLNYFNATTVGSFDPNFKEVIPAGEGPTGKILEKDSVLEYMVHFQNVGTYKAFNIVVIDTLDSDLDWTTFKPGYKSHPAEVTMDENGVLKYAFNNINLPPAEQDELLSNGMFTYSIKTKKNLAIGTQFTNSAAIYFDYNEPVITNTTVNTLSNALSTPTIKNNQSLEFSLYPNPATNTCYVKLNVQNNTTKTIVKVSDVTGKTILLNEYTLVKGEQTFSINTSDLKSGIYFVTIGNNNAHATQKMVVIK